MLESCGRFRSQTKEQQSQQLIARLGIGFGIGSVRPLARLVCGLLFGLLLSIPDAIIAKAYAPIIGMGAVGGAVVGWVVGRFGN